MNDISVKVERWFFFYIVSGFSVCLQDREECNDGCVFFAYDACFHPTNAYYENNTFHSLVICPFHLFFSSVIVTHFVRGLKYHAVLPGCVEGMQWLVSVSIGRFLKGDEWLPRVDLQCFNFIVDWA